MDVKPATQAYGDVIEAIHRFLAEPPEGIPSEIIDAFGLIEGNSVLPPRLFHETVEQAPVAISITDPRARILYANGAFEELTGYTRAEVLGKKESILSSKSTPVAVYEDMWKTIRQRRVWRGNLVNHRKGGIEYLAELSISPVLNAEGRIAYFLGMHRDITDLHQLQQRLTFQKGLTEAALNAAPMAVVMIDGDGRVLLDNYAYKALITDFKGVEPVRLFIELIEKQEGFKLRDVCGDGKGFTNVEVRLDPPGGREPRWFSCSGVRIAEFESGVSSYFATNAKQASNDRCHLLLLANEVTGSRRRTQDARLNQVRASMAEQRMNQAMREAISASIFKLQVPLNIIRASLSVSSGQNNGMTPVLQQALASGEEAMENLQRALPDVVVERRSSVNVNELLHEVLHLSTDDLLSSGAVVDWRPSAALPGLHGRANELRSLFKYLLDNAIQSLFESNRDFREIRVETSNDDEEVVVTVIDNGVGIASADMLKVFEPFYCRWQSAQKHAGMGLTMVQEIAIEHGGSVEIDREFAGGCRIFVRLPRRSEGESYDGAG